jgi:hypothetical protein
MDSKVVNREIRRSIWPALKRAGFDRFTSRVAWRHGQDSIDVFDFQSFNRYNAGVLGITTFSFAVNLGKYLLYVPPQWLPKAKDGVCVPAESECIFRKRIRPVGASKQGIWDIRSDGENVRQQMEGVLAQIPDALGWFADLADRDNALKILLERDQDMESLWGFGRNPSPVRSYYSGYAALALSNERLARNKLQEAVDSGCFRKLFSDVDEAIARAPNTNGIDPAIS